MAQQTAVDSLWDSLTCLFFFQDGIPVEVMEIYDQAKQVEKERREELENRIIELERIIVNLENTLRYILKK